MHPIEEIVRRQKNGEKVGIWSCCSANPFVLRAALQRGLERHVPVLIEATANQVNQFGGYTGMRPEDFYLYVRELAGQAGLPEEQLILGGDHLGPLTWTELPENEAMDNAEELVRQFVLAGFTKIHLDTSMCLSSDDPAVRLPDEKIARRGARLCAAAERAFAERAAAVPGAQKPVYIIGSEVPIPGGAQQAEDHVSVTRPGDCLATWNAFEKAFGERKLADAWSRVVGMVVQPGVEFGDRDIFAYRPEAARELTALLKKLPIVFEGHSTDYQTPECLRAMVCDGIAILKVGPALTFALREALFSLEAIETELFMGTGAARSEFRAVLEHEMLKDSGNWEKHYHGDGNETKLARAFSFSDRARYYLPKPAVQASIGRLIGNLSSAEIPLSILNQYLPVQYRRVREGKLENSPQALLTDRVGDCIDEYLCACQG